jgi:preprotein translocase subunit SecA
VRQHGTIVYEPTPFNNSSTPQFNNGGQVDPSTSADTTTPMPKSDDHDHHAHGPDCDHDHGPPQEPYRRSEPKIGRNDPCHCGSGKKFKKCHGVKVAVDTPGA